MPARGSGRHQAAYSRGRGHGRSWAVLIVIATGVAVAALAFATTTAAARILLASGTAAAPGLACPASGSASPSACPAAAPSANPGANPAGAALPVSAGSPTAERAPSTATGQPTGHETAAAQPPDQAAAAGTPSSAGPDSAVEQVLNLINTARAQAGLPGYTITAGLQRSSESHNSRMAEGCGLSHQCHGEPPVGERETDAGVHWTTAGENIGEGSPAADSSAAIAHMAVVLTQDMLNEHPPNDGHRKNLLSTAFRHIGIAIFRDRSGTVWITQDFSN